MAQCLSKLRYNFTLNFTVCTVQSEVRQLLFHRASRNAGNHCTKLSSHRLFLFPVCGEVEALELVLDAGANPSTPDIHGGYPIHYAAQMCGPNSEMGNDVRFGLAVLRKLLARGVEVNVRDKDGRQPILWAASAGWKFLRIKSRKCHATDRPACLWWS